MAQSLPALEQGAATAESPWMSKEISFLYERSWNEAKRIGQTYVSTEHLLLAVLSNVRVFQLLRQQSISAPKVRKDLLKLLSHLPRPDSKEQSHHDENRYV
jgi:ATP-dependent Clp protease ATP-binding subunit ClpA